MNKRNQNYKFRENDWLFNCAICNMRCFASDSVKLSTYTGRGGNRVCPSCHDSIDYGLVPYKIPAEQPIPWAQDTNYTLNNNAIPTGFTPFDYEMFNPMGTSPEIAMSVNQSWDELDSVTWDTWYIPWGTPPENS